MQPALLVGVPTINEDYVALCFRAKRILRESRHCQCRVPEVQLQLCIREELLSELITKH